MEDVYSKDYLSKKYPTLESVLEAIDNDILDAKWWNNGDGDFFGLFYSDTQKGLDDDRYLGWWLSDSDWNIFQWKF